MLHRPPPDDDTGDPSGWQILGQVLLAVGAFAVLGAIAGLILGRIILS